LLFANDPLTKTNSLAVKIFSEMYVSSRLRCFNCHFSRLFRVIISSLVGFWCYAVTDRSNAALGWYIKAMYVLRARCLTYFCLVSGISISINLIFLSCFFWRSDIVLPFWIRIYPLNINGESGISFSFGLAMNLAFNSSFFFKVKKGSSARIIISFICISTMLNPFSVVVISRYGS
jgi:hypothetical protein